MGKLTAIKIKALKEPGRYADGEGLILTVSAAGTGSWILRATIAGRHRDIGLGSLKLVTLAEARAKCLEYRRQIAQGIVRSPSARRSRTRCRPSGTLLPACTRSSRKGGRTASTTTSRSIRSRPTPFPSSAMTRQRHRRADHPRRAGADLAVQARDRAPCATANRRGTRLELRHGLSTYGGADALTLAGVAASAA